VVGTLIVHTGKYSVLGKEIGYQTETIIRLTLFKPFHISVKEVWGDEQKFVTFIVE
jgi:hypothetical protein